MLACDEFGLGGNSCVRSKMTGADLLFQHFFELIIERKWV
jgi:hypothetical protein